MGEEPLISGRDSNFDATGEVYEFELEEEAVGSELPEEVKVASLVGGTLGALTGATLLVGAIPVLGPVFAANTMVMIVGMSVSAFGIMIVGGLIGSILGGVAASFIQMIREEEEAPESHIRKNNMHVAAHAG